MRLGQLSRKLDIKSSEIIDFIQKEFNEEIKNHPNCKIPDDFVDSITENFKKPIEEKETPEKQMEEKESQETLQTKAPENVEETKVVFQEKVEEEFAEAHEDVKKESYNPLKDEAEVTSPETEEPNSENEDTSEIKEEDLNIVDGVIRAPKIESREVKVVGKIDIQDKKAEEKTEAEEDSEHLDVEVNAEQTESTEASEDTEDTENKEENVPKPAVKKPETNKRKPRKSQKKVVTYEEEKQKELEKYKQERLAKKKAEKEAKRKNYEKLIKEKQQQQAHKKKKKKKASKKKEVEQAKVVEKQEAPKTIWGKFLRWLNT